MVWFLTPVFDESIIQTEFFLEPLKLKDKYDNQHRRVSVDSSSGCNFPSPFKDKKIDSGKVTIFFKVHRVKHFVE